MKVVDLVATIPCNCPLGLWVITARWDVRHSCTDPRADNNLSTNHGACGLGMRFLHFLQVRASSLLKKFW